MTDFFNQNNKTKQELTPRDNGIEKKCTTTNTTCKQRNISMNNKETFLPVSVLLVVKWCEHIINSRPKVTPSQRSIDRADSDVKWLDVQRAPAGPRDGRDNPVSRPHYPAWHTQGTSCHTGHTTVAFSLPVDAYTSLALQSDKGFSFLSSSLKGPRIIQNSLIKKGSSLVFLFFFACTGFQK